MDARGQPYQEERQSYASRSNINQKVTTSILPDLHFSQPFTEKPKAAPRRPPQNNQSNLALGGGIKGTIEEENLVAWTEDTHPVMDPTLETVGWITENSQQGLNDIIEHTKEMSTLRIQDEGQEKESRKSRIGPCGNVTFGAIHASIVQKEFSKIA